MPERSSRVLVVEDDAILRRFVSLVLEDEGFEVRTASNGCDALLVLTTWQPGLILLDLRMPEMDGASFRIEQRRRQHLAAIPVLLVSAENDLERQAATLEVAGSVAKPYDLDELVTVVHTLAVTSPASA